MMAREQSEGSERKDDNPYDLPPRKSTDKKKAGKYFNIGEVFYNPFKTKKKDPKDEESKSVKSKTVNGNSTFREIEDSQDYSFFNEFTPMLAELKEDQEEQESFQIKEDEEHV